MKKLMIYGTEVEFDNTIEYFSIKNEIINKNSINPGCKYSVTPASLRYIDKNCDKDSFIRIINDQISTIDRLLLEGKIKTGEKEVSLISSINDTDYSEKFKNARNFFKSILDKLNN